MNVVYPDFVRQLVAQQLRVYHAILDILWINAICEFPFVRDFAFRRM